MKTGKTCRLFVSAKVYSRIPPENPHAGSHMPLTADLCAGHLLTLTGRVSGEWVECTHERGAVIWIEERFVSHAV